MNPKKTRREAANRMHDINKPINARKTHVFRRAAKRNIRSLRVLRR